MSENRQIYLMRHARPELPFGGRVYYGQTDYPLSADGKTAAAALGSALATGGISFSRVYTSDMLRAKETAALALPGFTATEVPAFREINLGEWEGRGYDEVRTEFKEIYEARGAKFASVAPPGGENFIQLQQRTVPAFEELRAAFPGENLMIVAHGAAIWSIMAHYLRLDLNDMFFFTQDYCGIHMLEERCGRLRLLKYNWTPALDTTN